MSHRLLNRVLSICFFIPLVGQTAFAAGRSMVDGPFQFVDKARSVGLRDVYWKGAMGEGKIITSEASGIGWGDYDGDGWLDLFLPQGVGGSARGHCGRLFRNDGRGGFEDVTDRAGIRSCRWGMGVLWEDLDGDGSQDLILTTVGALEIWWNDGKGGFVRHLEQKVATIDCWSAGIAALDYDRDGDLDLFGSCYLDTTPKAESERSFMVEKGILDYAPGGEFLLRNEGDRAFSDAAQGAGLSGHEKGRGLTVVAADFDRDGWPDLYVANDRDPNHLLRNRGDGSFEEVGILSGTSIGELGQAQAGMGVAVGDLDGNGWPDLVVTNFSGEPANLYLNQGDLVFLDESRRWGLEPVTRPWLSWSTEIVDFDNDGFSDLYVANAHLVPNWVSRVMGWVGQGELVADYFSGPYRQPFLFLRQAGDRFQAAGEIPDLVVRGASSGDIDRDGDLDLFLYSAARPLPSLLLENRTSPAGAWLAVDLRPPGARAPDVGDEILVSSDQRSWVLQHSSGGSFLSGSARPLHMGLGEAKRVDLEWLRGGKVMRRMRDVASKRFFILIP